MCTHPPSDFSDAAPTAVICLAMFRYRIWFCRLMSDSLMTCGL